MALFHRLKMPLAEEAPESITEPFGCAIGRGRIAPAARGARARSRRSRGHASDQACLSRGARGRASGRVAGRRLCDRIYARLCRSPRSRQRRDAAAFQAAIDAVRGKAGSRFPDPARRAQHARRGNAAGRADPGGLRIRRMVLPVDRRRPAAGTCGRKYHSSCCRTGSRFERHQPSRSRWRRRRRLDPRLSRRRDRTLSPQAGSGSGGRPSAAGSAMAAVPAATDPAPNSPGEVVIRATADSWIQIRDARQSVLLTRVLKAGESCRAPARPGLSMRTGNAGGLEITVDGVPAPPIGGRGMVRRNVALDGHALLAGSAVRN